MKLISKFEVFVNKLILSFFNLLKSMIPKGVSLWLKRKRLQVKHWFKRALISSLRLLKKILQKVSFYNDLFFKKVDTIKEYPFKENLDEKKMNIGIYLKSKRKVEILKDIATFLKGSFHKFYENKKLRYSFASIALVFFFTLLIQNFNSYDTNYRELASSSYKIQRSEYESFNKRTLKVQNVDLPIIVTNKKNIHSFLTDFYLRTDTVFAKLYLDNNQHKIRDRFYESTYRVPASFPLENEGKNVLKEKITFELNKLLKENRVEGKILEVSFDAPVAN